MLLVEITHGGSTYYASQGGYALTHMWKQYVISFGALQRRLPCDYGGYCAMEAGGIELSPALFGAADMNVWPPPTQMDIAIKYTATDEASAVTLLSGTAQIARLAASGVRYDIYPEEYTDTITTGTSYNDTLVNVVSSLCTTLGLSLNSTYARSPSPTVAHTLTADRLLIDMLSDFCRFYTHLFYIQGGTLHLVDALADGGSRDLGVEYCPPEYIWQVPVAEVTNSDYSEFSTAAAGRKITQAAYHGTGANILAAFEDIIDACNVPWMTVEVPFEGTVPVPGEKLYWTDDMLQAETDAYLRARHITYDFDRSIVRVEGAGGLAAA